MMKSFYLVLCCIFFFCDSFPTQLSARPLPTQWPVGKSRHMIPMSCKKKNDSIEEDNSNEIIFQEKKHGLLSLSRRDLFSKTSSAALGLMCTITEYPTQVQAMAEKTTTTPYKILRRLRSVPTFCIVNNEGVPFLIFDGQAASATATGYFFLSFSSAVQALQGARREDAKGVWSNAKIIIVPLGVSLQLSLSETQREAINNGIAFNALSKIIVSSEGIQNAKQVELDNGNNPEKWSQIEKVPLFYIDGLKLSDGREPRYFNQLDLWREWDRQHPVILYDQQQSSRQRPRTQIVDMLDLYRTAFDNVDAFDKIANLALVPVEETVLVGKELMKISIPPNYNVKQGYLVQ
mmetsp:Transcript_26241/g.52300  ORF Transcript_26241/g.52300 Transcript_26241/m.52300 type:complete len:348 (-) Transcript_26241:723-1766(-)